MLADMGRLPIFSEPQITHKHRAGKVFYLELDGEGKMPVLHFGMTGMLHVNEVWGSEGSF